MMKTRTTRRLAAAASPDSPEPSPRERLLWLLAFLRRDVATLRPGEWLDLRHDVQRHLWPMMRLGEPTFEEVVRAWHLAVGRGLDALDADGRWTFPAPIVRTLRGLQRQPDGTILPAYQALPLDRGTGADPSAAVALLASAVELLVPWWPQLRRCRHCRAWFLPRHGRQWYHDPGCSFQARWSRFAPTRKRDYHAEYTRLVKRAAPGARPERRPRRPPIGTIGARGKRR